MLRHSVFILGILISVFGQSTGQLGSRLACGHCENAASWDDCFDEICNRGENCYINITQTDNGKRINAGCTSQDDSRCSGVQQGFLFGSRDASDDQTLCETCCHSDNCNVDHCKNIELKPLIPHTGIKSCHQCKLRGIIWQCTYTDTCSPGQVCFAQELFTTGAGHFSYYHGGCTDQARCDVVNLESFSNEYRLGEVARGVCCYETNCNNASIFSGPSIQGATDGAIVSTTLPPTTTVMTSTAQRAPLQCMQCVNEGTTWNCDHVEQCANDEICYVQELELTMDIPPLPRKYSHAGCAKREKCSTVSTTSMADENGLATVSWGQCCSTDNCNKQLLEYYKNPTTSTMTPPTTTTTSTTTAMPTSIAAGTTTAVVERCMQCVNEGIGWNCERVQQCAVDEVCFVQELEFEVYIPGTPKTYFHGGCIHKVACDRVGRTSLYDEHGLAGVIRGECCFTNDCNKQIYEVYNSTNPSTTTPLMTTTTQAITTTVGPMTPLQCMQCINEGVGWNCDHVQQCSSDESCFVQELDLTIDIPTLPDKYFHGGCISTPKCSMVGTTSMSNEHGLAAVANGECCTTDNCNKQILEYYKNPTTASPPTTTTPSAVRQCMECVNEGVSWKCGYNQTCSDDQICFIQELTLNIDIPTLPSDYFHAGCIDKDGCSDISTTSVKDEHGLSTVTQGQCCNSDNCNKQLWTDYQNRK